MNEAHWEVVYVANGSLQAELLRGLLEAQEIPVVLSQEGAGKVYALTVGPLGRVEILVPVSMVERATQILQNFENGAAPDSELFDPDSTDEEDWIEEDDL